MLHAFLGLIDFYRRFIRNYATIIAPLTNLLNGKHTKLQWNEQAHIGFTNLKHVNITALVLAIPNFVAPLDLETNASSLAIGTCCPKTTTHFLLQQEVCHWLQAVSVYTRETMSLLNSLSGDGIPL